MSEIIDEIMKHVPEEKVDDVSFEGANIVLYTEDKDFFLNDQGLIRDVVNKIKKRVELRPDPSVHMDEDEAEATIKEMLGEEAGIDNIIFDSQRSLVTIEVEKPGVAIGKGGSNLQDIKEATMWVPEIKRKPPIRSNIIENIRSVIYANSDYRRKFLHKTGKRIYNGWIRDKKEEWIRLSCLGASRQVGRSAFLLQTPESRILLDCGMDMSDDDNAYPYLEAPEFDVKELDAIIVSHAHLDHCALVPYLFKYGYRGPVYCTAPTRDIMSLSQLDFVKIQRGEGNEPIYTSEEVKEMVKHTITLDYEEVTDITPDVRITLYNAGHMLGSAVVHIHVGNGLHNFVYTGDIKYAHTSLLSPANTKFPRVESMMIESTYGGRDNKMPPSDKQDELLTNVITETIDRGGKILMPVLGSGRAQEIVVLLHKLLKEGKLPEDIPIFIDGMVWDMTAIHTAYPEFFNKKIRDQIFHDNDNPFLMDNIQRIKGRREREQKMEDVGPCIVMATSGMLVGGPSVSYLKMLSENEKNSLIFSSYQPAGCLGRRILQGLKEINFKEGQSMRTYHLKMQVHRLEITGHSDRRELMNYIRNCNPRPNRVFMVHGEESRCLDFASSAHKAYHVETMAPRNLDAFRLR
jgi:hypothetical protein